MIGFSFPWHLVLQVKSPVRPTGYVYEYSISRPGRRLRGKEACMLRVLGMGVCGGRSGKGIP